MKKIFSLLVFLFVVYFGIQVAFRYFDKGHTYEYTLNKDKKFEIKEILIQNIKNEKSNYYIEVKVDNIIFNVQSFDLHQRATGIIRDIKYFSNTNYTCILPLLSDDKILTDIICKKGDKYYYYNTLKGNDAELDNFANENLDLTRFNDSSEVIKKENNISIYNNIPDEHYIAVDYFRGIYAINKQINYRRVETFGKEQYGREISTIVGKYYFVADYDQEYDFHIFKLVNLESYSISTITSDYEISLDSYIQGVVGNSVYLFDKVNKKQYKIDIKNKEVTQCGNENGIKIYKNGEFLDGNAYVATKENIIFDEYGTDNILNGTVYSKVVKSGNALSGYYYVYEKVNNSYNVYRASVQNTNILTYLFTTTDFKSIQYADDYVYFKDSGYIKYFSPLTGIKTLVFYKDMQFNNNLKFYIYVK